MENLKEALEYVSNLATEAESTEVVEICGKTYANKKLSRYDYPEKAAAVTASSLSSMVDYIENCNSEFPKNQKMIIHIESPKRVRLMSSLDAERNREVLFEVSAETSEFRFDAWLDQERFMIELQANFVESDDLKAVMRMAGNIDRKNNQSFTDDGVTQVATITAGVATKVDALVPNPVTLYPYRTFQEVEQPSSKFVFRIGDKEVPAFKIVEAEGGIWKNEAVSNIKKYFKDNIHGIETGTIVIIG